MKNIYVYAAHGPFAPGACCFGRNEWIDNSKFAVVLADAFGRYTGIRSECSCCSNLSSLERLESAAGAGADAIFVLHRGYTHDNSKSTGAVVYVPSFASAAVQYEASAMLNAFCENTGIKNRGVHLPGHECFYRDIDGAPMERVFLFETGCIDSIADNKKLDANFFTAAFAMAESLVEIWKEGMKK